MMSRDGGLRVWLLALVMVGGHAGAQNAMQPYQEYDKRLRATEQAAPLTSDLFGDQVSLYDRSAAFEQVDISLPGNSRLAVELRRRLDVRPQSRIGSRPELFGGAENWEIMVPYITGTFDSAYGWNTTDAGQRPRCSTNFVPRTSPPHQIDEIWSGYSIVVPGSGSRELIGHPIAAHRPPDGKTRVWTTREFDTFSCVPMRYGYPGEGFLMTTADGISYRFDVGTTRMAGMMQSDHPDATRGRPRIQVFLLASRVSDRFGNWVDYTYDGYGHPDKIVSNDGRQIDLIYSGSRLVKASAHGRSWDYAYQGSQLSEVIQPDRKKWTFAYSDDMTIFYPAWNESLGLGCGNTAPLVEQDFTVFMSHPSGAQGSFLFRHERHGRSGVPEINCVTEQLPGSPAPSFYLAVPNYFDRYSLATKTIQGAGFLQPQVWSYSGSTPDYPLWSGIVPPCLSCPQARTTVVTQPDGSSLSEDYGIVFGLNEGKLLGRRVTNANGAVLRTETLEYMSTAEASGQPFPDRYGYMYGGNDSSRVLIRPLKKRTIVQQGASFTWQANVFDVFARPLSVEKRSTVLGALPRTETTSYYDHPTLWVLGQPLQLTANNVVTSFTSYNHSAMPEVVSSFGKTMQTTTYGPDGTVASIRDGRGNLTSFLDWKRGVPQLVRFSPTPEAPGGATLSAMVSDSGWITQVINESGARTQYEYDVMGRMIRMRHPEEDTSHGITWNDTTHDLSLVPDKYQLPEHWRWLTSTGNMRTETHLDAMWRPVIEERYDAANPAATRSLIVRRYDAAGRLAFQSYPLRTLADYRTVTSGTYTEYDALGRVTKTRTPSADGPGGWFTTTTEYLAGFAQRVTSPNLTQTTTRFMAWDDPTTDYPVAIAHPEGAFTDIARDAFGKPTAITRRDASSTLAVTRTYAYDAHQQLCRSVEPETGATLMGYDAAGNLAWSAAGLPAGTACQATGTSPAIAARRVDRGYDARNRLTSLDFPDANGNQAWDYYADGKPRQITTWNIGHPGAEPKETRNLYAYYRRGLLKTELIAVPAWYTFSVEHGYNANGHETSLTYPSGQTVTSTLNALGQPVSIAGSGTTYAGGITYHPNGAVAGFTYGNNIVHAMAQNDRQLPDAVSSIHGSTQFLRDEYDYDGHGNVLRVGDLRTGKGGRRTRSMSYDGLDRLTSVASPMYGSTGASYDYNVLDDLTRVRTGGTKARDHHYCYDATRRLTNIRLADCAAPGGGSVVGLHYDVQGNLSDRNGQGYRFDFGNRLREVDGVERYRYDGHGRRVLAMQFATGTVFSQYGLDGRLLYQKNDRTAQSLDHIYLAGSLVAIREQPYAADSPAVVKYQHTDALGSPVAVTRQDRTIVEETEYEPYGQVLNRPMHDGAGYTGHVEDAATGLVYMQQRYYDPTIGRFLSVDPVTASANTGANFNRYKYAANNPYKFIDPDGRYECQGSARSCAVVDRAVAAVNSALSKLEPGTSEHGKLSAVSQALGQKGDRGITFKPQALRGDRVFARAGKDGLIRVDTGKIERGLASYNAANPHMQSEQVSDALGGRAVTHETQHQIDYKKPGLGYPTNRDTATLVERSAYSSQAAFDRAAGLNSDLWNPHMSPETQAQKIEDAASRSVNDVWGGL